MILSYSTTSAGPLTLVTVVSSLAGTVYYNWFLDGQFVTQTQSPQHTFALQSGQQASVDCIDSNSATLPDAPAGWPSTRTLIFVRSLDAAIASYEIQQQENAGSWVTLNSIADDPARWSFTYQTSALEDLADYAWQVIPIGQNGNAGTPVAIAAEFINRTPDAPDFSATVNPATGLGGFSSGFSSGFQVTSGSAPTITFAA